MYWRRPHTPVASSLLAALLLGGCASGLNETLPATAVNPSSVNDDSPISAIRTYRAGGATTKVTVRVHLAGNPNGNLGPGPLYAPTSAQTLSLTVKPAGKTPVSGKQGCKNTNCSITLNAPSGAAQLTVALLGAKGRVVASGSRDAMLVPGIDNLIPVAFGGVPASVVLSISPSMLVYPEGGTGQLTALFKDADGNTILGPGTLAKAVPIVVSGDARFARLGAKTFTSPQQTIAVTFASNVKLEPITFSVRGVPKVTSATIYFNALSDGTYSERTGDAIFDSAAMLDTVPFAQPPLLPKGMPATADLSDKYPTPTESGQGRLGSCVAYSLSTLYTYVKSTELGWHAPVPGTNPALNFSPSFVYDVLQPNDFGRPNGPGGLQALDALTYVSSNGVATQATMPYYSDNSSRQPDAAAVKEALNFRLVTYAQLRVTDRLGIRAQLAAGHPVWFAALLDRSFGQFKGDGVYTLPEHPVVLGGHMMNLVGYDDTRQAYKIRNSWGSNWRGDDTIWVSYATFEKMAVEVYVLTIAPGGGVSGPTPPPAPMPFPKAASTTIDPSFGSKGIGITGSYAVAANVGTQSQLAILFAYDDPANAYPFVTPTTKKYSNGIGDAALVFADEKLRVGKNALFDVAATMPYSALGVPASTEAKLIGVPVVYVNGYAVVAGQPFEFDYSTENGGHASALDALFSVRKWSELIGLRSPNVTGAP